MGLCKGRRVLLGRSVLPPAFPCALPCNPMAQRGVPARDHESYQNLYADFEEPIAIVTFTQLLGKPAIAQTSGNVEKSKDMCQTVHLGELVCSQLQGPALSGLGFCR